jgi:transcriptional regulator with XRE-family HTH domain
VSRVHLANVESDDAAAHHRTPSLALLGKLAEALKVSVAELVR